MADDNWHHIEGTYVAPNVFRVYFYDDFSRPIAVTGFSATAVETDADGERISAPVALLAGQPEAGNTLEAPMQGTTLPVRIELRAKFKPDDRDRVFNFTFASYSEEPAEAPAAAAPMADGESVPLTQPYLNVTGAGASAVSPLAQEEALPTTLPELLSELGQRMQSVADLIDEGNLSNVWFPALRAKDIALALEEGHLNGLPPTQRPRMQSAVKRLTLAAWKIDAAGDFGYRQLLVALYEDFSETIEEIQSLYGEQ